MIPTIKTKILQWYGQTLRHYSFIQVVLEGIITEKKGRERPKINVIPQN
jgi:hypothetical protein